MTTTWDKAAAQVKPDLRTFASDGRSWAANWTYSDADPGIGLFGACLKDGTPMTFAPGSRVLEIGCCEADWLSLAHQAWPDVYFVGIDTRASSVVDRGGMVERKRADVMQADLFPPETFDGIVSLSAIEHIGLTHYGDPQDADGDRKALANAWTWLKPGGWFYFDVPYAPKDYRVCGTSHRQYHWAAVNDRLLGAWQGTLAFVRWAGKDTVTRLEPEPTTQRHADNFDHYIALVLRKAA